MDGHAQPLLPGERLRDRPQEGRRADRAQLRKQLLGGTVGKIQYLVIEPLEGVHAARRGDDQIPVRQIDAGQRVDTGRADHVAQVAGNLAHAVLARVSRQLGLHHQPPEGAVAAQIVGRVNRIGNVCVHLLADRAQDLRFVGQELRLHRAVQHRAEQYPDDDQRQQHDREERGQVGPEGLALKRQARLHAIELLL